MPALLRLILWWIADLSCGGARRTAAGQKIDLGYAFGVDAEAVGLQIVLAGWKVGRRDLRLAGIRCAEPGHGTLGLRKGPAPGEPDRVIVALELAAVLIAGMVFVNPNSSRQAVGSCRATGGTDFQGNALVIAKFMSTRLPSL
jgi:hypothetical protein